MHSCKQWLAVAMMFLLLLFSNASREWLHEFAAHTDTVHTHSDDLRKGIVFENEHHHCQFLDIPLPSYLQPGIITAILYSPQHTQEGNTFICCRYSDNSPSTLSSRGPPAKFHIS